MVGFIDLGAGRQDFGQGIAQSFRQAQEADLINQLVQQAQTGGQLDTDALMNSLLGANIDPAQKQLALQSLGQRQQLEQRSLSELLKAGAQQRAAQEKLGVLESEELKSLGKGASRIPRVLGTVQEARELLNEMSDVQFGPIFGQVAENVSLTENQQALKAKAANLITEINPTLPRIKAEFEAIERGGLSFLRSRADNLRLLDGIERSLRLEDFIIKRTNQLRDQGLSEGAAFRQAKQEADAQAEQIVSDLQSLRGGGQGSAAEMNVEQLDKFLFG